MDGRGAFLRPPFLMGLSVVGFLTVVVKIVRQFFHLVPLTERKRLTAAATEPSLTPTHIRLNILLIMRGMICRFETAVASVKIEGSGMLSRWRKRSKGLILIEFSRFTLPIASNRPPLKLVSVHLCVSAGIF